jgi:VIT1/CCC1 family predicted Fe2+/Mn2+ transporter
MTEDEHHFLLQRVQPAMVGLIDGSLSTLAPIFGIAFYTHRPHTAFIAGLATSIGAAISMAFSEGLSDTGELTGRGSPQIRGAITGIGTFLGGILHTLPFLITNYHAAVVVAAVVVAFELIALAVIRWKFFQTGFLKSLLAISVGGAVIAVVGALIGSSG